MIIPFGPWTPDEPENANQGCLDARNVLPTAGGYEPMPGAENEGGTILGSVRDSVLLDGTLFVLSSTGRVYRRSGSTFVSEVTLADAPRQMQVYNDVIVVARSNGAPFIREPGGTWRVATDISVGAEVVARVRDWVVLGDVDSVGNAVKWSAYNNYDSWTPSRGRQSDEQNLPAENGNVIGVVSGEVGLIFQQRAITRMSYVGPPLAFRFDEVARLPTNIANNIGRAPIRKVNQSVYFASDDARFYRIGADGSGLQEISTARVTDWCRKTSFDPYTIAADPDRPVIYFRGRCASGALDGTVFSSDINNDSNAVLVYNYDLDQWSYLTLLNGWMETYADRLFAMIYDATLTDLQYNELTDDSAPLDALVTTREVSQDGAVLYVDGAYPLIEADANAGLGEVPTTLSVTPATRGRPYDPITVKATVNANDQGRCNFRHTARYHRFTVDVSGPFTKLVGVSVSPQVRGNRSRSNAPSGS